MVESWMYVFKNPFRLKLLADITLHTFWSLRIRIFTNLIFKNNFVNSHWFLYNIIICNIPFLSSFLIYIYIKIIQSKINKSNTLNYSLANQYKANSKINLVNPKCTCLNFPRHFRWLKFIIKTYSIKIKWPKLTVTVNQSALLIRYDKSHPVLLNLNCRWKMSTIAWVLNSISLNIIIFGKIFLFLYNGTTNDFLIIKIASVDRWESLLVVRKHFVPSA